MFDMMQEGGAFELIGWMDLRDYLFRHKRPFHRMVENALGGCEKCTALWWSFPWFAVYAYVVNMLHAFPDVISLKIIGMVLFICINFSIGYKSLK